MAYGFYRALTIDKTKVPNTNRTDFPVLVSGTYSWLATVANGGKVQHASGYDVAFYSDAALTTQLKHEIERWIATTGEVVYHVKVPTVSTSVDTVIYIAYGDAGISTDQSDAVNVWDTNYKGVWHFPNGTTLTALDSTANDNDGTISGATATTGQVGGGANFDGNDTIAKTSATLDMASAVTVEAWFKLTSLSSGSFSRLVEHGPLGSGPWTEYALNLWNDAGVYQWYFELSPGGTNQSLGKTGISTGTWYHAVGVYDGSNKYIYHNGSQAATSAASGAFPAHNDITTFGYRDGPSQYFNGVLDEVRISSVARSADWIATEYNNQNSPSTFYAVGAEVVTGRPRISALTFGTPIHSLVNAGLVG